MSKQVGVGRIRLKPAASRLGESYLVIAKRRLRQQTTSLG